MYGSNPSGERIFAIKRYYLIEQPLLLFVTAILENITNPLDLATHMTRICELTQSSFNPDVKAAGTSCWQTINTSKFSSSPAFSSFLIL